MGFLAFLHIDQTKTVTPQTQIMSHIWPSNYGS